jgi:hypothetical protein
MPDFPFAQGEKFTKLWVCIIAPGPHKSELVELQAHRYHCHAYVVFCPNLTRLAVELYNSRRFLPEKLDNDT